ncbi:MAG TPA: YoaK family protein, partial [Polyangiaceae bacterium]|nr:YoaK family protein [Polyangiaceae bacterium]
MGSIRKAVGDIRHPAAHDDARVATVTELSPASRPRSEGASGGTMPSVNLHWHSTLLSAVAGYVDAAGFASLLGLFPAHLTGELVADVIAISSGHFAAHTHLWSFPVFVGAVALATLVARVFRHHGLQARAGLLALVTLALALFSVSDALPWLLPGAQLPVILRGGFAVAAMGFQSALMRESLTGSCPTTVMTGNLTQAVIEIVDQLVGKLTRPLLTEAPTRSRRAPVARVFLVFMFSAALGGWLTRVYGSLSVTLPTLVTAALTIKALREDRERRALASAAALFEEEALWTDVFPAPEPVK